MSNETKSYPRPREDEVNRPYLDAWRAGRLELQHCTACGRAVFYPREMCPYCWSTELEWRPSAGHGTIVAFSLVHRPNHPSFFDEVPIVLAEVRLEEGALMLARVLCDEPAEIRSGLAVRLASAAAGRYPLPTFAPAESGR